MKKRWSTLFYIVIVAGLGFVIYWIAKQGSTLQSPALTAQQLQSEKAAEAKWRAAKMAEMFEIKVAHYKKVGIKNLV